MKKGLAIASALLALSLCLAITLLPQGRAIADFGDYSGGSDYGGSDSGGSDWGGSGYDFDYGGSGSDSGSGSSLLSPTAQLVCSIGGTAFAILASAGCILYAYYRGTRGTRARKKGSRVPEGATRTDASMLMTVQDYRQLDPAFDEAAIREKLAGLYADLQHAWTRKDLTGVRRSLTDAFYAQMDRQLASYRDGNRTNHVDDITVELVAVQGFRRQGSMDHMIVAVTARIVDYTVDDSTGRVIGGTDRKHIRMEYEWELVRRAGAVTGGPDATVVTCPNCGAPVSINATARCPYCDSVITVDAADWAIMGIKGISKTTLNA